MLLAQFISQEALRAEQFGGAIYSWGTVSDPISTL